MPEIEIEINLESGEMESTIKGIALTNLRTNYNLKSAEKLARNLRGTLHKERVGSTIKIRIKY